MGRCFLLQRGRPMILNICTHSDYKYLLKGLALYQSLFKTLKGNFVLHYLCNDTQTFDAVKKIQSKNLKPYNLLQLESDPELQQSKNNPCSNQARSQYEQYCWCLTPYFVNYILKNHIGNNEFLIYADSDIYFYETPLIIINAIKNKSIGIHTHKFGGINDGKSVVGWYNCGVVAFRKDECGLKASDLWKNWLLYTNHEYYQSHGTCGDQKYLELFEKMFPEQTCVFDEDSNVGHLAPWCISPLEVRENGKSIFYKKWLQKLVFFHFSHFNYDITKNTWKDHNNDSPEWQPALHGGRFVNNLYQNYFKSIKEASKLLKC